MTVAELQAWTRRHRWALALIAVVVVGYSVGKDAAMRDNRADAVARTEARL